MITGTDDIVNQIVEILKDNNAAITAKRGSVVHDGFVLPTATAYSWGSALNAFSQGIQSLDQILVLKTDSDFQVSVAEALGISTDAVVGLLSSAIDRRAADHKLYRKSATKAYGTAYFYTTTAPTENLTVPSGTVVETSTGIQFVTTSTAVMLQSQLAAYYDSGLLAYSIAVPVEAVAAGPESNISADQLIYPADVFPNGFTGVTNKYLIDNGHSIETDEELVERIKTTLAGISLQTAAGMKALVLNNMDVRSVFIADASSPYQVRNNGKGGVVDVYTIDSLPTLITDNWVIASSDQYFVHQPVIDVISVVGVYYGDLEHEFARNVDYFFVKDSNPMTMNSVRAYDKIIWPGAVRPTGTYKVTYAYNQLLESVQSLLMQDQYRPLMGDITNAVLAREGTKVGVDVSYQIVPIGTYSPDDVKQRATRNVMAFINSLGFGAPLSQSDIINVIENTPGVNSVSTTPVAFNKVGQGIEETLTVRAFEYLRASAVVIF